MDNTKLHWRLKVTITEFNHRIIGELFIYDGKEQSLQVSLEGVQGGGLMHFQQEDVTAVESSIGKKLASYCLGPILGTTNWISIWSGWLQLGEKQPGHVAPWTPDRLIWTSLTQSVASEVSWTGVMCSNFQVPKIILTACTVHEMLEPVGQIKSC